MKRTVKSVTNGVESRNPMNLRTMWSAMALATGATQKSFFTKEEASESFRNYLNDINPFPNGQGRLLALQFALYNASWADLDLTSAALHTAINAIRNTAELQFYHGEDVWHECLLGEVLAPVPHQITVAPVEAGTASNAYGANATALADRQEAPMSGTGYMLSMHANPLPVESNLNIKAVVNFSKVTVPAALNNHLLVARLFAESWHKS